MLPVIVEQVNLFFELIETDVLLVTAWVWQAHHTSRGLIGNAWRDKCASLCSLDSLYLLCCCRSGAQVLSLLLIKLLTWGRDMQITHHILVQLHNSYIQLSKILTAKQPGQIKQSWVVCVVGDFVLDKPVYTFKPPNPTASCHDKPCSRPQDHISCLAWECFRVPLGGGAKCFWWEGGLLPPWPDFR